MKHHTVAIIGGGIAGLTTAIALKQIGIEGQIFESSPKIAPVGAGLGLGANAIKAFKDLGIFKKVVENGQSLPSFTIYNHVGKIITKTDFTQSREIVNFAIHRVDLHNVLLSQIDPTTIYLNKRVIDFAQTEFGVKVLFSDGSSHFTNYLIVADGVHSIIRKKLNPNAQLRYAGYTCWRAVINNISSAIKETSETWGAEGRFGIVPLANEKLYWFACINTPANNKVFGKYKISNLIERFRNYHSPIPEILYHTSDEEILRNDIFDIKPLERFTCNRIILIGDAADATAPNLGQGACQAIEDAVVLAKCMQQYDDTEEAFKLFDKRRIERTEWITNMSRKIGRIAQIENALLIKFRNQTISMLPDSINKHQLNKISNIDFGKSIL